MALPHQAITPIPNTEPDAVPSLWNERYDEIDENFAALDEAVTAVADEVAGARHGHAALGETVAAIVQQLGGISGSLSSASAASVQQALGLDWLYNDRRMAIELFAPGYYLHNRIEVAVSHGATGDDSLHVDDSSSLRIGEEYLLSDPETPGKVERVKIASVLNPTLVRVADDLVHTWSTGAALRASTFTARDGGGVSAAPGDQWISRAINLGDDNTSRAVVIRRSHSAASVRLFFRDNYQAAWAERQWSTRRLSGEANGIPEGFADYEYSVPLRGDGYLRVLVEGEPCEILHIAGVGRGRVELGGSGNQAMIPDAPVIAYPADEAFDIALRPTLELFSAQEGTAFAAARFQIAETDDFASILHDSGEIQASSHAVPDGVLQVESAYYVRALVKDSAGLLSPWSAVNSFTTSSSSAHVATPSITLPLAGDTNVAVNPTLRSSAFVVVGGEDDHAASQWQVRMASASWSSPVHDSGEIAGALLTHSVPVNKLQAGKPYVARVRHKGSTMNWSEWSNGVPFTTAVGVQAADVFGVIFPDEEGEKGTIITENLTTRPSTPSLTVHPIYAGIIDQVIDGQAMVRIPRFYVKAGVMPSGARYILLSHEPRNGFKVHPAFMRGGQEIEQFWVGKYAGSADGGKLASKPGGHMPLTGISFEQMLARANARNVNGVSGFQLWDVHQNSALRLLQIIAMSANVLVSGSGDIGMYQAEDVDAALIAPTDHYGMDRFAGIYGLGKSCIQMIDGLRFSAPHEHTGKRHLQIFENSGSRLYITTELDSEKAFDVYRAGDHLSVAAINAYTGVPTETGWRRNATGSDIADGSGVGYDLILNLIPVGNEYVPRASPGIDRWYLHEYAGAPVNACATTRLMAFVAPHVASPFIGGRLAKI